MALTTMMMVFLLRGGGGVEHPQPVRYLPTHSVHPTILSVCRHKATFAERMGKNLRAMLTVDGRYSTNRLFRPNAPVSNHFGPCGAWLRSVARGCLRVGFGDTQEGWLLVGN